MVAFMSPRFTPKPKEYPTSAALLEAYNDFIFSRQSMQCTEATLAFYRNTALKFLLWAEKQGVSAPTEVTARLVREYLAGLAANGKTDTTCHDHARAIRTLIRFWHGKGYISEVVEFEMPRLSGKQLPILNKDQVKQVAKVCNTRDKAIVLFIVDSGLRRSEVINLNWGDLNIENGLVRVKHGKGKRDRSTRVGVKARQALLRYRKTVLHEKDMPMFQSRTGNRFTGSGLLLIFRRLSKSTGIHITPDALRRRLTVLEMDDDFLEQYRNHSLMDILMND
jgi:site-specific recombinase XerD